MSAPNTTSDIPDLFDFPENHFNSDIHTGMEPFMLSLQCPSMVDFAPSDSASGAPSGTVSPKDLMTDSSVPPSTCFTEMSTPSFESPGYFSQNTSPLFVTESELGPGHEEWDSLFPPNEETFPGSCGAAIFNTCTDFTKPQPGKITPPSTTCGTPPPGQSPAPRRATIKHSTVSGINARQRKPLPPIKYDSNDPVAIKRARNTEAARKSRARKLERQDEMESRIAELMKELEESRQREQYWKALAESRADV